MKNKSYYFELYEILNDFRLTNIRKLNKNINKLKDKDCEQLTEEWTKIYKAQNFKKILKDYTKKDELKFFPSSSFQMELNSEIINRSLLYVDKLVLYDPLTSLIMAKRSKLGAEGFLKWYVPIFLSYKPLFKNNVAQLIPQRNLYVHYTSNSFLGNEIMNDTNDKKFVKICNEYLSVGKTDTGMDISFFNGSMQGHLESVHIKHSSGITNITQEFNTDLGKKMYFSKNREKRQEEIAEGLIRQKAAELNMDILTTQEFKANLVSESDMVFRLLDRKSKRKSDIKKFVDLKYLPSIMNLDLPTISNVKTNEILKVRKNFKDEFKEFRRAFQKSIQEIESLPYSTKFKKEIESIQADIINPELNRLNKNFQIIKKHRILKTLGSAFFTTFPLIGSIFVNDIYRIMMWAMSSGLATNTLNEICDLWKETQDQKKNAWYFLWKLT